MGAIIKIGEKIIARIKTGPEEKYLNEDPCKRCLVRACCSQICEQYRLKHGIILPCNKEFNSSVVLQQLDVSDLDV